MYSQTLEKSSMHFDFEEFSDIQITETEQQFSRALQKFAGLFLKWRNASLGYFSTSEELISIGGENCLCDNILAPAEDTRHQHVSQKVFYNDNFLGTIVLCCPSFLTDAGDCLSQINNYTIEELMRQEDEAALLAELGTSWESLQAVYDLNTDLNSFQNPQKLLEKITERAAVFSNNACAVLWLEKGEFLEPVSLANVAEVTSRAKDYGLIGEVFSSQRSIICNNTKTTKIFAEREIEFQRASRIAAFPVATRITGYGVLAVWYDGENGIFDSRATHLLGTLAVQAAMIVETERLYRESIENEKLQQEIEIGSNIQQILLTGKAPEDICGVKISALTIPSKKIDGDFYDFVEHGEDCFDIVIGDVMGKGIPAALVGAATKNCFLRAIGQLQSVEQRLRPAPEKIVGWVNNEVTAKLIRFESFVTACYARFDLEKNILTYVDCGHTKTLLYSRRTGNVSVLEGENMPLGFSEREIFKEKKIAFEAGDVLLFYSDGVTETRDTTGEFFGDKRLADFICQNALQNPKEMVENLLETLKEFSGEKKFDDDLTCVIVSIEEKTPASSAWKIRQMIDSDLNKLEQVRQFVRKVSRLLPKDIVNSEFIEQLELAVNEAAANIILHAYNNQPGNKIELSRQSKV